jgi:hypothetical protein
MILKQNNFNIELLKVELEITFIELEDLTIFEKFIIKIIDKAEQEKISLIEKIDDSFFINYNKISEILAIDKNIIENNINKLFSLKLLEIENDYLSVIWSQNLKNWKKEILNYQEKTIYLSNENGQEFLEATLEEQNLFVKTIFSETKEIKIISNEVEKVEFEIEAVLENKTIKTVIKNKQEISNIQIETFKKGNL